MKLAFYKGTRPGWHGLFNRAVRWWTRGPYSHVELVFSDGLCGSASGVDGGVRLKSIMLHPDRWDLVPIAGDETYARDWFARHAGRGYDYLGLFGFVWRPYYGDTTRFWCSEAIAAALQIDDPWRVEPNGMAPWARVIERVKMATKA